MFKMSTDYVPIIMSSGVCLKNCTPRQSWRVFLFI